MSVCQMKIPGLLGSLYLFSVPQLVRSSAGIVSRSFGSTLRVLWPGHSDTVTVPHVKGLPGLQAGCPVWEYPLWMPSCLLAGLLHPAGMTTWGAVIVGCLCFLTPCLSSEAAAMHVGVSLAYLCLRRQSWLPPQPLSLCELAVL